MWRAAAVGALVTVHGAPGVHRGGLQHWQVTAQDEVGLLLRGSFTIARGGPLLPHSDQSDSVQPHLFHPLATAAAISDQFPADLAVLAGHFPGAPLIPGVYLLALLEQRAGLVANGVRRAKFLHPVLPGQRLDIRPGQLLRDGLPVCVASFSVSASDTGLPNWG